ncbi:MAG: phosphatidylglycerophosphatase A [Nitrospinaceae bacterium]|jgi:phosphatidylglycerophosphatase A|nr:phosphatidylglycerophosphatase A [Nitrospinaceae bacterium]MBT3822099.1 phosphatidylglycerophosphatase A [Nitrospinaceae bacterium]MBT4095598.1 phosphatidylglycerophosphatase A [Nitrospinaceae bacterium]MBT4429667.1 phosphatidylglycerophosphatase A [Nitrospinaceae bacterium]MBT5368092.1 phosphatidylglycerophosphatase A [Nitrospinaceae bacterium]
MSRASGAGGAVSPVLARIIATMGGAGYSPIAPGTVGSIIGVTLYWVAYLEGSRVSLAVFLFIAIVAIWSAGHAERAAGKKDPSEIIVDEVAGQFLCLLGHAPAMAHLVAGLVVFRILDIWKPFRWIEKFPGGWGIVADDLMAGGIGWVLLALGYSWGYL